MGYEHERFMETSMASQSFFFELNKGFGRETTADFFLQGLAAGRGIDNTFSVDCSNIGADPSKANWQYVEDEAGVDSCAENTSSGLVTVGIGEGRFLRSSECWKEQLLAGGNNSAARFDHRLHLFKGSICPGTYRVQHRVHRRFMGERFKTFIYLGGSKAGTADDVVQAVADQSLTYIYAPNYFESVLAGKERKAGYSNGA
ncbi:hypothetical protein GCM10007047_19110 [Cerasicoccus arenae]|uniref:Uncharacterized protein n=1 Tax=Cerasicoccus arenae TaxID=424488 RepID=A0A8J3DHH2_9BACT|nr:hypothetical protein GCM10007047_19110 [Cerasicoccus arenae]